MKRNAKQVLVAAVCCLVLALGCAFAAGCGGQQGGTSAQAGTETTPKLMPAAHQKYVDRTAYKCYKCHGASEKGNPTAKGAVAMPDGHYVNADPSSFELDPIREQCRSCHTVDSGKQMDESKLAEAEAETGQDNMDGK